MKAAGTLSTQVERGRNVKHPKFFPALDDSSELKVVEKLGLIEDVQGDWGIKINLDIVLKDFSIIGRLKKMFSRQVFVDLKMWNGKRTMAEVMKDLARAGADMTNVYAHAGRLIKDSAQICTDAGITLLGVTVLTHYDEAYCRRVYNNQSLADTVKVLTEIALENGCHGVILPGTTLHAVAKFKCKKFNPAVRPLWFPDKKANDQEQEMAPGEAFKAGADITSCGSPVFKSPDPAEALKLILEEIEAATKTK